MQPTTLTDTAGNPMTDRDLRRGRRTHGTTFGMMETWNTMGPKATGITDLRQVEIQLPIHDLINRLGITIVPFD